MPSFDEAILTNKGLIAAVLAAAFAAAVILVPAIARLAFGPKLRPPGNGRARQPRLGIVDVFVLDHKRRLVIVRRDNVEHLLLIGGPNDLVVEAQIVRADRGDLRLIREARIRDKEAREKDQRESTACAAELDWQDLADSLPPGATAPSLHTQRRAAAWQRAAASREPGQTSQDLAKSPPLPVPDRAKSKPSSVQAAGSSEPLPAGSQPLKPLRASPNPRSRPLAPSETQETPVEPTPPAFLRPLRLREAAAAGPERRPPEASHLGILLAQCSVQAARQDEPPPAAEKTPSDNEASGPPVAAAPPPPPPETPSTQALPDTQPPADTIEEEMARLLGRG